MAKQDDTARQDDLFHPDISAQPKIDIFVPARLGELQGEVSIRQSLFNKNEHWISFRVRQKYINWCFGSANLSAQKFKSASAAWIHFCLSGGVAL